MISERTVGTVQTVHLIPDTTLKPNATVPYKYRGSVTCSNYICLVKFMVTHMHFKCQDSSAMVAHVSSHYIDTDISLANAQCSSQQYIIFPTVYISHDIYFYFIFHSLDAKFSVILFFYVQVYFTSFLLTPQATNNCF